MQEPRVVYEDNQVVVIDKPAGMVVNRAETVEEGKSLQDWVESKLKIKNEKLKINSNNDREFENRAGIVHRLDKDTSGVMVIAKTQAAFVELQRQFRERETEKVYMALVHGKLEPKEGAMRLPLGRSRANRKKFTVGLLGKVAETGWQVREYLKKDDEVLSLVELYPKTGRTHQLRVHLKHLGHPIVGDRHYLNKKRIRQDERMIGRQFLHAKRLCFWWQGEKRCFEAELAGDLRKVLEKLIETQIPKSK